MQSLDELWTSDSWVFCRSWWATLQSWYGRSFHHCGAISVHKFAWLFVSLSSVSIVMPMSVCCIYAPMHLLGLLWRDKVNCAACTCLLGKAIFKWVHLNYYRAIIKDKAAWFPKDLLCVCYVCFLVPKGLVVLIPLYYHDSGVFFCTMQNFSTVTLAEVIRCENRAERWSGQGTRISRERLSRVLNNVCS